jgi:hypothetical protein
MVTLRFPPLLACINFLQLESLFEAGIYGLIKVDFGAYFRIHAFSTFRDIVYYFALQYHYRRFRSSSWII